jgi:hypothetical protein
MEHLRKLPPKEVTGRKEAVRISSTTEVGSLGPCEPAPTAHHKDEW